jgi:hypothetical protein
VLASQITALDQTRLVRQRGAQHAIQHSPCRQQVVKRS